MQKFIMLDDKGLRDVVPLQYGEEKCPHKKAKVRVMNDYYLLHYVYSGVGYYYANDQIYTVTEGQLFSIHPHEAVYYEPDHSNPWHLRYYFVEAAMNSAGVIQPSFFWYLSLL